MKILYIAPEHVSGTLSLFKKEHERRGDICRFVTFWHSRWDFPDDICLNLSGMPNRRWVRALRNIVSHDPHHVPSRIKNDKLPVWKPNPFVGAMFSLRDERNWRRIWNAIKHHGLFDFDVVHFDGGLDFTRDSRFARSMKTRGKGIVAYYHGSDLRSRGFVPQIDQVSDLRLTPEWDLAVLDKRLKYLFLPVDLRDFEYRAYSPAKRIRIGHAARNPLKGTAQVQKAIEHLGRKYEIDLVLIKDLSYSQALSAKRACDLFIDQLTNQGGWGYGMSGVEALAMGIPVITNIPLEMRPLLGEHPFIQAEPETLLDILARCIESPTEMSRISAFGREWVHDRHDVVRVADTLYGYYRELGWLRT